MSAEATGGHELHRKLIGRLEGQAEDVRRLTSDLDEGTLARRTNPAKWSVKELVCHLDRIQELFAGRVEAMLDEDEPAIASYEPENDPEFETRVSRPTAETLARFQERRRQLLARLAGLGPEQWHRKGRHPEFAHYDVHYAVEYMTHHEAHHIYQIVLRRPAGRLPH